MRAFIPLILIEIKQEKEVKVQEEKDKVYSPDTLIDVGDRYVKFSVGRICI